MFTVKFLVLVSFMLIDYSQGENKVFCPDPAKATDANKIADKELDIPGHLGVTENIVVIPERGILPAKISCILINDLTSDESSGHVEIVGGGLQENYVRIKLTSRFLGGMKYSILVYK